MIKIVLITHNLRSTHNVGSLFRTAEGLGVDKIYLTGYTPYPLAKDDERLPYLSAKIDKQIQKTALGAEKYLSWEYEKDIYKVFLNLRNEGYKLVALEQSKNSIPLTKYRDSCNTALIVGREVEGLEPELLQSVDEILEIPMSGKKESFNVVQAAAMALYHLRFYEG